MTVYKDLNITGRLDVENKDAVMQKLKILLSSHKDSNFFFREYECDIRDILFMPFTLVASHSLEHRLKWCIASKIPELELISIDIQPDYDRRIHNIKLNLSIEGSEAFEYVDKLQAKIK